MKVSLMILFNKDKYGVNSLIKFGEGNIGREGENCLFLITPLSCLRNESSSYESRYLISSSLKDETPPFPSTMSL